MIRSSLDARIPNRPDQQVHFTDDAVRSLIGQKVTLHACGEGNDGDYPPVGKAVVASATVDPDGSVVIPPRLRPYMQGQERLVPDA